MSKTTVQELGEYGQSIWLDYISRSLIEGGELKSLIDRGLLGMTSNPTIFEKAVKSSNDYDEKIKELEKDGKSIFEIYDELTVTDVQDAADLFLDVYKKTDALDGYVSLEVNPQLAMKLDATVEEAKRLFKKVNRPNVMFKVPATKEGVIAVEKLVGEGMNINATLMFSVQQYIDISNAYIKGLVAFAEKGNSDLSKVNSVASVFVSRIDVTIDKSLSERIESEKDEEIKEKLSALKGKAAVANSELIYDKYLDIFMQEEFQALKFHGARPQRVLWGSTGTKDPSYSDIKYVTELIGKGTVNTLPTKTLDAFFDHGIVKGSLPANSSEHKAFFEELKSFNIKIDEVCEGLLKDGVNSFTKSFESLLTSIESKAKQTLVS